MRKRFFLGAGRWLTAIAIGFCLFRLLWDGAAAGVPFDTVTAAVVQSVDLSQTKTADGQMLRRLCNLVCHIIIYIKDDLCIQTIRIVPAFL